MAEVLQLETRNKVLRFLSPASFALLAPALEPVILARRMKLVERDRPCEWVHFPSSGIASVVIRSGLILQEMGIFGCEGIACLSTILGARRPTNMVVMQVPGVGHRIPVSIVSAAFHENREIRDAILNYVLSAVGQINETALANTHLNITQRLARWLLMIHDRVDGNDINLTHDYLSLMLGVARPGVTVALQSLEREGMITTARGLITIANRKNLLGMTGGIYCGGDERLAATG